MPDVNGSVRSLRTEIFSKHWPLDEEIRVTAATLPSHSFLANSSGQYLYVYLTRFVKALSEKHFARPFSDLSVLDWGCGKGHVSKLIRVHFSIPPPVSLRLPDAVRESAVRKTFRTAVQRLVRA